MSEEIDTFNKHMVGLQADKIIMMMPPRGPMSNDEALVVGAEARGYRRGQEDGQSRISATHSMEFGQGAPRSF